jgi:hypothetical protein
MVSLQKLLGKEDRFFDLFEASAEQARDSVRAFRNFLAAPETARTLDEFEVSRRRENPSPLNQRGALHQLCQFDGGRGHRGVVQPYLQDPKTVEKVAERILLAPQHLQGVDVTPQVAMLEKATESLLQMVRELRKE